MKILRSFISLLMILVCMVYFIQFTISGHTCKAMNENTIIIGTNAGDNCCDNEHISQNITNPFLNLSFFEDNCCSNFLYHFIISIPYSFVKTLYLTIFLEILLFFSFQIIQHNIKVVSFNKIIYNQLHSPIFILQSNIRC